ncbi:VanW family protein [Candidatus Roizmanbacteria bacterium]|nr:VanW family protein [Candidatus Roizmanbacteria bacterium]
MITNPAKNHTLFVRVTISLVAALFFGIIITSTLIRSEEKKYLNKIYPHVFIDDISVGDKTKKEVFALFNSRQKKLKDVTMLISYNNAIIATFSASTLNIRLNIDDMYEKAYLIGRSPHTPSRIYQQLATIFNLQKFTFASQVQYDKGVLDDSINQFKDAYNRPAKNALFKFENGRVVSFQREEAGNMLLTDPMSYDLDQYIRSLKFRPQSYTMTLRDKPVQPEITLAKSNSFGIEELIGEGVSNYTHSIPGRIHNVVFGASKFNGVLIPKGKTFSFNDTIGDISANTGYQPAYIIKEGKTVLGDGGGVCQISTTLFRAALNSGLPIIERYAHAYRVSYYENGSKPGLDATVFAPTADLKIENNTPAAILIQTTVDEDNMLLYFRLYGKKDGRNAEISTPLLWDVAPPPTALYQDDPTLKRGITKQVDFPAWGGKASFNYKVTRANQVIFEKKFVSIYKPWQAIYLVGVQD